MGSSGQLAPGSVLGDWVIERLLGQGGMAEVYLARFPRLQRLDVLKVMRPWLSADPSFRRRFAAEAQLMCDWRHPHVVTVYDHRQQDDLLYIAMQYVPQGDLRQMLNREGSLPVGRALAVAAQIADALDSGHERGLVHRDVKPENVLVERWVPGRDHVLLSDFGISRSMASETRLTQTGQAIFSPLYAAPEQWSGGQATGATDQYAFACLLYELLTGSAPFSAESNNSLAKAHLVDQPPLLPRQLALPPGFDGVFARALAKQPAHRFPTCSDFVAALHAPALGGPETVRVGARTRVDDGNRSTTPKRLALVALAAAVVVAGALVGLVALNGGDDASTAGSVTPLSVSPAPAGAGAQQGGSTGGSPSAGASAGPSAGATGGSATAGGGAAQALAARFATTHRDCVEVPVSESNQVASVRCQPLDPGVDLLTITQFRTPADVRGHMNAVIAGERLSEGACSGSAPAWQTWAYADEQTPRGRFACYKDDRERAMLQWTFDADELVLTAVRADGDLQLANAWWSS